MSHCVESSVLTWKESQAVESSGWEAGLEVWVPSLKPGKIRQSPTINTHNMEVAEVLEDLM